MGSNNNACLVGLKLYLEEESLDKKKQSYDTSDWCLENRKVGIPQSVFNVICNYSVPECKKSLHACDVNICYWESSRHAKSHCAGLVCAPHSVVTQCLTPLFFRIYPSRWMVVTVVSLRVNLPNILVEMQISPSPRCVIQPYSYWYVLYASIFLCLHRPITDCELKSH